MLEVNGGGVFVLDGVLKAMKRKKGEKTNIFDLGFRKMLMFNTLLIVISPVSSVCFSKVYVRKKKV